MYLQQPSITYIHPGGVLKYGLMKIHTLEFEEEFRELSPEELSLCRIGVAITVIFDKELYSPSM